MKLTIGKRILIGFGVLEILALGLGGYLIYTMSELRRIESTIKERDLHVLDVLKDLTQNQGVTRGLRERSVAQSLLSKQKLTSQDPKSSQEQWRNGAERTVKLLTELEANMSDYEKTALSPSRKVQWGKMRQNTSETLDAWKNLTAEVENLFENLNRGDFAKLADVFAAVDRLRQAYDSKISTGTQMTKDSIELGNGLSAATYDMAKTSSLVGLALLLLLGTGAALFIQRSINRPLGTFIQFTERVGQGDLTQQAAATDVTDLEQLGGSLNLMVAGLKGVAQQTISVTQSLNTSTAEIMASTQQQAASTKEQAATVQEITTTMEEVSQSGAQISTRAKQVAAAAEATSVASTSGLRAVQDTTRTMASIREQVEELAGNIVALSEKTQAVGEIIATVNDIAERSNLLALNAAIEAASAGEQGSRFSIVANEMKNLADQAKESTVQVRAILGDIQKGINSSVMFTEEAVKRVEIGRQQADIAERTIRQMNDTTLESVQAFEQIIGAGNQQQIGFEQVAQGMKDIRQAASQTAAATAQLEKALVNLNGLSQELKKAVARYQI